jgi:UDP-glucose 4-epimerase
MKILVTGSTGFIGRNINEHLTALGDLDVISPNRKDLDLLNSDDCKNFLIKHKPDLIVHSAVDINSVENTLKMFLNLYNHRGIYRRIIQLGSGAEYDNRHYLPRMKESQFGKSVPVDTYGLAKYLIAREIESSSDMKAINIRLFGIFGKYENYSRRFISNNIVRVLCGFPISINRNVNFDYISVDDLSKFIEKLIYCETFTHKSYNFCRGESISLYDLAQLIQSKFENKPDITIKNDSLGVEYSGDSGRLLEEFGPFNFEDISSSIDKLITYYRDLCTDEFIDSYVKENREF